MKASLVVVLAAVAAVVSGYEWRRGAALTSSELLEGEMRVRVELVQRNMHRLRDINHAVSDPASPARGHFLSSQQVRQLIGQPESAIRLVTDFLQQPECSQLCPLSSTTGVHGDYIFVNTCPLRVQCLFGVTLASYTNEKGVSIVRAAQLLDPAHVPLPQALRPLVFRVVGVADLPVELRWLGARAEEGPGFPGLNIDPNLIRANYGNDQYADVPSVGQQSSQACGEFQHEYFRPEDLTEAQAHWGLPENNVTNIVGDDNWGSLLSQLGEASLDFQYISTVENLETWAFIMPGEAFDLIAYCQLVLATPGAPLVQSLSYGGGESIFDADTLQRTNNEFLKMTTEGYTLLAASGDSATGSTKLFSCPQFDPTFPATSPYVTAVGATYLVDASGDQCVWASGGSGFSTTFARPSWQDAAVTQYLSSGVQLPPSSYWNSSGRAIPDLAAYGTNYLVNIRGRYEKVAGTSASCPVVAAMVAYSNALRDQTGISALGNINPTLYAAGAVGTDITCGESKLSRCDYGFFTAPGWDPATGLGTPLADILFNLLD